MLWFKKQPKDAAPGGDRDLIEPAVLSLPFDSNLFQQHLSELRHNAELDAGVEVYLESLRTKQTLFAETLAPDVVGSLDFEKIEVLLETVFSARRRVFPVLQALGLQAAVGAIRELLYGSAALTERMERFAGLVPVAETGDKEARKQAGKNRRAMHDFGAEMLHFRDPLKYPLMSRWVWDQSTVSGALREFIRGNDSMVEIPLGNSPEMFEGVRKWLADQIAEQGIYKDVPLWVDLMLAEAYSAYFRSMAEGLLSADFGRSGGPEEHVKKFLGIDALRKDGRSRVKKDAASDMPPSLN